jgi:nucleoside 2-deoxyribosyltransferase
MKLYLCGPINGRSDDDANGWRQKVKAAWHGECIDPMRRDYRGREMEPGIAAEIVAGDLADIDAADALIVYFDRPSVGTAMEVFYAASKGKPVALVNTTVAPLSPWLLHHCSYIGRSLADALCHLAGSAARMKERGWLKSHEDVAEMNFTAGKP